MKTNEVKDKVAAKVGKAKDKVASKCSCGKACAKAARLVIAGLGLAVVLSGCTTAEAPTAQRAQSCTVKDINIVFNINSSTTTNAAPAPVSISMEFGTAAQANETSGTETATATPTQTPTTDIKPQTTLTYGLASGTAAGNDWIASLTAASAQGLANWLRSGNASGTMIVTKKDGSTETVSCKDGSCTLSSGDCVTCRDTE